MLENIRYETQKLFMWLKIGQIWYRILIYAVDIEYEDDFLTYAVTYINSLWCNDKMKGSLKFNQFEGEKWLVL